VPDIRGLKRTCVSCATKFYDFNKSPIFCPKCGTEFTGIVKVRTRRGRNVIEDAKAKAAADHDDDSVEIVEDDEVGVVSLEEIGEEEDKAADDEDEAAGDLDLDDLDADEDEDDLEDLEDDIEIEKE
jgi:uncharacterized protein (TIGR02300 family)